MLELTEYIIHEWFFLHLSYLYLFTEVIWAVFLNHLVAACFSSVIVDGHCFTDTWNSFQVMMNSMNVPSKRSTLERQLDKLILALFATLFAMSVVGAIGRCVILIVNEHIM